MYFCYIIQCCPAWQLLVALYCSTCIIALCLPYISSFLAAIIVINARLVLSYIHNNFPYLRRRVSERLTNGQVINKKDSGGMRGFETESRLPALRLMQKLVTQREINFTYGWPITRSFLEAANIATGFQASHATINPRRRMNTLYGKQWDWPARENMA